MIAITIVLAFSSSKKQLLAMINDIKGMSEALTGYFDEAKLRETYPKVNEFLQVINVRDDLPF